MTNTEIQEGEKSIDMFMEKEFDRSPIERLNLKYHSSWDLLMRVVKKIEDIEGRIYYTKIINGSDGHRMDIIMDLVGGVKIIEGEKADKKIKAVWLTVVNFSKWYNQNKNP